MAKSKSEFEGQSEEQLQATAAEFMSQINDIDDKVAALHAQRKPMADKLRAIHGRLTTFAIKKISK